MVVAGQHATNLAHPTQYTQHIMVESYQLLKTNVYYLALLKLTKPLEWTLAVGPACLPFYYRDSDFLGQYLTMVGWGQTGANESRSAVLLKTKVSVISLSECQQIMPEVYNTEICTYTPPRGGCVLDTGGPAYFLNVRQFLIGIIGYRHECGLIHKAGVNVRVGSFLKWIQQNVGDRLCLKF
ncbi:venom serine protease 34-like isoform X1 [Hermetia illucens]|nr:venom serine protease 34-like isoform X1 [Hermetia illucens]XP_037924274.1 venom serine protease 34-like isoform X1 [Hermetia illucens]